MDILIDFVYPYIYHQYTKLWVKSYVVLKFRELFLLYIY